MPTALAADHVVPDLIVSEEAGRGLYAARMHDGPVQDLLATRYLADLALSAAAKGADVEALQARLESIREAAALALTGSRRLMGELTARTINGVGLAGALRSTAALVAPGATVTTGDDDDPELGELPPAVAVTAHRLAGALLRACADPAPHLEVRRGAELTLALHARVEVDEAEVAGWIMRVQALGGRVMAGDTIRITFPLPTVLNAPEGLS